MASMTKTERDLWVEAKSDAMSTRADTMTHALTKCRIRQERLADALSLIDARLMLLGRANPTGPTFHAVIAMRDIIAKATA